MAFGDSFRVNTNLQSLQSYQTLQKNNSELGMRQMRLATGSRLNRAEDDSAGYTISQKMEAKVRGQAQALSNIGDAKSMLTVAEGSLNSVMDILHTMKEKSVQAANDTLGTSERTAIENELDALASEINDIAGDTTFNGQALFTSTAFNFQVNAESSDTFTANAIGSNVTAGGLSVSGLDVSSASAATGSISSIDSAISTVAAKLSNIGDDQKRLTFKQENLTTSMNNNEAARSRIADADFAKEQMQIVKLQILQQTGTASLAQANAAPQSVLSLIG